MKLYCYHCCIEFEIKCNIVHLDNFFRIPYRIDTDEKYSRFIGTQRDLCVRNVNQKKHFSYVVSLSDIANYKVLSLNFLHEIEEETPMLSQQG
jgi:hypothetical protein